MARKTIGLVIAILLLFSLAGCKGSYGTKPKDLDDPMPELWEERLSGKAFDTSAIDIKTATEITIGADITDINLGEFYAAKNLQNIFVADGNQKFASDDGVLYSKSYQTLYKWPTKKLITELRETIKYFAPYCFYGCDMPEDFEIPNGTITIGGGAFEGTTLTEFHIKQNVKTVGSWKYSETTKQIKSYGIYPETCKTVKISTPIVYASFFLCNTFGNTIETVIFNEGVRQIRAMGNGKREHLFFMMGTKNIEFPSTLEVIGDVSFPVNVMVANYVIPERVVYLGKYAFDDYYVKTGKNAKPVNVPRNVETTFDCKGEVSIKYIEKHSPEWAKNRNRGY